MAKYLLHRDTEPGTLRIQYEKELNPEQLEVVLHGDGPCLVLAGAGSGKTRTIVYRVAYLLERGVHPDEILLVTFTNKAAREMMNRITEVFGQYPKGLWGGTFHHVAHVLLRKYAKLIGYQPNFTILDQEDAQSLLKLVFQEIHAQPQKGRFPSSSVLNSIISLSRNTRFPIQQILERYYPNFLPISQEITQIAAAFAEKKKASNSLDFDDLLEKLRDLLDTNSEISDALSRMFRYILVDEYQDTNRLQGDIVTRLARHHGNILVVGDDAQSIYSFRGAEIQNILQFPKQFSGTTIFKIETNYRSTPEILHLANESIRRNTRQYKKDLKSIKSGGEKPSLVSLSTQQEEADFITQRILELHRDGLPLSQIAVLFRASHHSQTLEFELTRREIPYEYRGGIRFFERAHIKDVLAYLKVIENSQDEISWHRILLHQEGIGEVAAKKIIADILKTSGLPESIKTLEPGDAKKKGRISAGWTSLRKTLSQIVDPNLIPQKLVELVAKGDYNEYLQNEFPNADERSADLEALTEFAGRYESLQLFLAEVTLQESFAVQADNEEEKDNDRLVLSTVHQAKGLEWDAVFVMNLTSSAFPHPKSVEEGNIEEERRLFYVATTRAKDWLYLTYAVSSGNTLTGYAHINTPSIFLHELPQDSYEPLEIVIENDFGL